MINNLKMYTRKLRDSEKHVSYKKVNMRKEEEEFRESIQSKSLRYLTL